MYENKWFLVEYIGNYEWKKISKGFRNRKLAQMEYLRICKEQNIDMFRPNISIMQYEVEIEVLPKYYGAYAEYEFTGVKIYEAYAEYRMSEQW